MGPLSMSDERFTVVGYEYHDGIFESTYTIHADSGTTTLVERVDFSSVSQVNTPEPLLLRLLALTCSLSYYKATSATSVEVGFGLDRSEQEYFAGLIEGGLAEFAYRNKLPDKLRPKILVTSKSTLTGPQPQSSKTWWDPGNQPLVAIGGGKDSVVTIEVLKSAGLNPLLFSVNQFDPIDRCVEVSGCDYVQVTRKIDPHLHVLNQNGATNGHVPVTAINSIIGLIVADVAGLGPLVMSNEKSASSGNLFWDGLEVNHQWSKGLKFEDLLRFTLVAGGLEEDRYFSLLRSLREIDIAEKFASYTQYFPVFTSCNRVYTIDPARRESSWCRICPKCLFVFLILAPFIPRQELVAIFGGDPLDEPDNIPLYEEILGLKGSKPFECVGEFAEAAEALQKIALLPSWSTSTVVVAIADALPKTKTARVSTSEASRVPEFLLRVEALAK
jgi:hypothetical protein